MGFGVSIVVTALVSTCLLSDVMLFRIFFPPLIPDIFCPMKEGSRIGVTNIAAMFTGLGGIAFRAIVLV